MTREKAIAVLEDNKPSIIFEDEELQKRSADLCVALDMAISALKQNESANEINAVLEQIRAEIADLDDADYDYEGYYKAVTDAVNIIDKYTKGE